MNCFHRKIEINFLVVIRSTQFHMSKKCNKCEIEKPTEDFYKDSSKKDGLTTICKDCIKKRTIPEDKKVVVTEKVCSKCKKTKPADEFCKDSKKKDGLRYSCKECYKPTITKYHEKNRETINMKKAERRKNPEVKEKERAAYKVYYNNPNSRHKKRLNDPQHKDQTKEYRSRPEVKERIKQNNIVTKPIRLKQRKERYKTNPDYRLKMIIRSRLHKALSRNKTNSSFEYVGCDVAFLKKWLEFRFDENMNWDNFGTYWHIDHILPIAAFDTTNKSEHICFHWTNLQPLESIENQSKKDNIHLHYFYNNIVNVFRFNTKYKQFIGYQAVKETLQWLKKKDFRYGNNSSDEDAIASEIGNPQPSL